MTVQLIEIPIGNLLVAENIRLDPRLDQPFVTNIRQHGIRVPLEVAKNDDGTYDIIDGQRRFVAATEIGLEFLAAVIVERPKNVAELIADQISINEHRSGLTEAELVAGYKKQALFGWSADQIARKSNTPKKRVQQALAIADGSPVNDLVAGGTITLDRASALVEFDEEPDVLEHLTRVAVEDPTRFDHAIENAKRDRAHRVVLDALTAELTVAGIPIVEKPRDTRNQGYLDLSVSSLYRDAELTQLLASTDTDKPEADTQGLAGQVVFRNNWTGSGYEEESFIRYYVIDWREHGYFAAGWADVKAPAEKGALSDEEIEAERAERRRIRENNKAWPAACAVRTAWIQEELLARKSLPDDTQTLISRQMLRALPGDAYTSGTSTALDWLTQTPTSSYSMDRGIVYLEQNPKNAERLNLAIALASVEISFNRHDSWRELDASSHVKLAGYLRTLESWGYGLSALEASIVESATTATVVSE